MRIAISFNRTPGFISFNYNKIISSRQSMNSLSFYPYTVVILNMVGDPGLSKQGFHLLI